MALQAGKIQIDFTCNYPTHRVAWQLSTDPPGVYTIVEPASPACAGGGVASSVFIDVMLDHETCDTLTFQGYIQPTCEALGSPIGQVNWNCNFVPDELCYSSEIECISAGVASLTITDEGTNYNPAAPPAVTFSGGAATATAYVSNAAVRTLSVNAAGAGYADAIYYPVAQVGASVPGGGTGALYTVEVVGGVVVDAWIANPSTDGGAGYAALDVVTLGAFGGGAGATLNVDAIFAVGNVMEVVVTAPGAYAVAPTATIAAPPGGDPPDTTATVDVVMAPCTQFTPDICDGTPAANDIQLELGQSVIMCDEQSAFPFPEVPGDYSQAHAGCCYDCITYGFTLNSGSPPEITYFDCATGDWLTHTLNTTFTECIVEGAYYITPFGADVTVTPGPSC